MIQVRSAGANAACAIQAPPKSCIPAGDWARSQGAPNCIPEDQLEKQMEQSDEPPPNPAAERNAGKI
jgi:hypothetical protein